MIRKWKVVRLILEQVEKGTIQQYTDNIVSSGVIDDVSSEEFLGHIEILIDAGILRNCTIERDRKGNFIMPDMRKAFISMQGHDLLDALRDSTLWNSIVQKSVNTGVSLSWEFIKAAIPVVIKEILNR